MVWASILACFVLFLPFFVFADEKNVKVDPRWYQEAALWIGNIILSIAAAFTWMGGLLLDLAIEEVVLAMGEVVRSEGIGHAINNTWEVVRDICNLAFIFGFIYIGIWTIINPGAAQTKRFLTQLIIAALLINFSLFFTKVVIDVANIFALEIYEILIKGTMTELGTGQQNVAYAFMQQMGLETFFDGGIGGLDQVLLTQFTTWGAVWFFVLAALFLLIAAFVLAAGAVMLIIRFVGLVLIMIFSPILFAATIFPQTARYASELWGKLLSYAFFAPAYLFLLYIALQVSNANFFGAQNQNMLAAFKAYENNDSFTVILKFAIIIMFLVFALQAAKQFGIRGGEAVVKTGNYIRGGAQGYLGRGAMRLTARPLRKAADRTHTRMSRIAADKSRWAPVRAGAWAAAGVAGSQSVREGLRKGETARFGSTQSIEDVEKYKGERRKRSSALGAIIDLEEALASNDERAIERAVRSMTKTRFEEAGAKQLNDERIMQYVSNSQMDDIDKIDGFTDAQKEELHKTRAKAIVSMLTDKDGNLIPDKIRKASTAQLEAAGFEFLQRKDVAGSLAANQIDDLRKSKKFLEAEVGQIEGQRKQYFDEVVKDPARVKEEIEKRKPKDAAKLPHEVLAAASEHHPKEFTPEIFHQMIDQKIDRKTQQKVYSELKKEYANLDQTMKDFLDTGFVQSRFESNRGSGGQQGGGAGPQGGGGQGSGGWTNNPAPGIGGRNRGGGNQSP